MTAPEMTSNVSKGRKTPIKPTNQPMIMIGQGSSNQICWDLPSNAMKSHVDQVIKIHWFIPKSKGQPVKTKNHDDFAFDCWVLTICLIFIFILTGYLAE